MVLLEGMVLSSAHWAFILQFSDQAARNNSMPSVPGMPLAGTSQLLMVPVLTAEAFASAIDLRRSPKLLHVDMQAKLSAA